MTFQPAVPLTGYAGWQFLSRTRDIQQEAYVESAPVKRLTDHFREEIGKVSSLDDFMNDRSLLQVALGAYGLDDDLGSTAFIRKVLEDGSMDPDAFANRLGDSRYAAFSKAMGFGDLGGAGRTQFGGFTETLIARYEDRQFARAVGDQDVDMRLALNFDSGIRDVLDNNQSLGAQWFAIMGNQPLRRVVETALGFGPAFGQIDIDQQREQLQDRARRVLSTDNPADFTDPGVRDKIVRLFLVRSEAQDLQIGSSSATALTLLQQAPNLDG